MTRYLWVIPRTLWMIPRMTCWTLVRSTSRTVIRWTFHSTFQLEVHLTTRWTLARMTTTWRECIWWWTDKPRLAKEISLWLVDYDQRIVEDDEEDHFDFFAFGSNRDETLTLVEVHKMCHGEEVIKVRDAMIYMTGEADQGKIMDEALIKKHWASI